MTAYPLASQVAVTSTGSLLVTGSFGITNQIFVTTTGTLPVSIVGTINAANPSVSLTGSNVPGSATYVGGSDPSGSLQAFKVDSNRNLFVTGSFGVSGVVPVDTVTMKAKTATYTYAGGNVSTIVTVVGSQTRTDTFGYDALNNLTSITTTIT